MLWEQLLNFVGCCSGGICQLLACLAPLILAKQKASACLTPTRHDCNYLQCFETTTFNQSYASKTFGFCAESFLGFNRSFTTLFFKLRPFCRIVYPYLQLMGTKIQNKQHTSKLRTWYLLWKQAFLNTRNIESLLGVEKQWLKDSSNLSSCLLYPGKLIKPVHLWNITLAWSHRPQNLTVTHDLLNKWSQRQLTHGMGIRGEKNPLKGPKE